MYEQVEEYLVRKNLLYEFQFGFRAAYSTDTCFIHLFDYIQQNFDEGKYVGMILLDLQKAFDTVNHAILLSKLQSIGFRNTAVKWFISYLTGRIQVCDVEGTISDPQDITWLPKVQSLAPFYF